MNYLRYHKERIASCILPATTPSPVSLSLDLWGNGIAYLPSRHTIFTNTVGVSGEKSKEVMGQFRNDGCVLAGCPVSS